MYCIVIIGAEASAQNALLKYLSMFNGASASDLAGVKDLAAGALVGAIEAPLALSRSVDTTGIMSYSAVLNVQLIQIVKVHRLV